MALAATIITFVIPFVSWMYNAIVGFGVGNY
jgi:hypothetical protein